ncbi:MAG TPA: hypothetical protein VMV09_07830 [Candidatus Saccharimonadales bacterium]|nr:hypothetical protein [Candidatus Saccharimonadales bacterium]
MRTECPVCGERLPESLSSTPVEWAEVATAERGAIAQANAELRAALEEESKARRYSAHFRRCLDAIDACLSGLEDLHLANLPIAQVGGCQAAVRALVAETGEEPPASVRTARNSYALHEALLDWESAVLDALVPRRRELFPDLNRDWDERARTRRHRRRGHGSLKVVTG